MDERNDKLEMIDDDELDLIAGGAGTPLTDYQKNRLATIDAEIEKGKRNYNPMWVREWEQKRKEFIYNLRQKGYDI